MTRHAQTDRIPTEPPPKTGTENREPTTGNNHP